MIRYEFSQLPTLQACNLSNALHLSKSIMLGLWSFFYFIPVPLTLHPFSGKSPSPHSIWLGCQTGHVPSRPRWTSPSLQAVSPCRYGNWYTGRSCFFGPTKIFSMCKMFSGFLSPGNRNCLINPPLQFSHLFFLLRLRLIPWISSLLDSYRYLSLVFF